MLKDFSRSAHKKSIGVQCKNGAKVVAKVPQKRTMWHMVGIVLFAMGLWVANNAA
jgi:translation initiation factor IF-1